MQNNSDNNSILNKRMVVAVVLAALGALLFGWYFRSDLPQSPVDTPPETQVALDSLSPRLNQVLIIGLDGANWVQMTPLIEAGRMPNLAKLMQHGSYGHLETLLPTISPMIWTSIATGKLPEKHGITDFTVWDDKTQCRVPATGQMRKSLALWNLMSYYGAKVGVVNWWTTWPAEEVKGFILTDMAAMGRRMEMEKKTEWNSKSSPSDAAIYYPPELAQIEQKIEWQTPTIEAWSRLANLSGADRSRINKIATYEPGDPMSVFKFNCLADRYYLEMTKALLKEQDSPELLMYYINSTDALTHVLWKYAYADGFPEMDSDNLKRFAPTLERYYEWVDDALGQLLSLYPEDVNVILVSDHGMIGMPDVTTPVKQSISARHTDHALVIASGKDFQSNRMFTTRKIEGEHFERWYRSINYQEQGYRNLFPGGWMETILATPEDSIELVTNFEKDNDTNLALQAFWDDKPLGAITPGAPLRIEAKQGLHRLRLALSDSPESANYHPESIPWTATKLALSRPDTLEPGKDWGYTLWQDPDGIWHLRWTAYQGHLFEVNPRFSGSITCERGLKQIDAVPASGNLSVEPDGNTLRFEYQFTDVQEEAGIDFVPLGPVQFDLKLDGDRYPRMVYLNSVPRVKVDRIRIKPAGRESYGPQPSVLDVAPTTLALFGLPEGSDMDGRVWNKHLKPAILDELKIKRVQSYETLGDIAKRVQVQRNAAIDQDQMNKLDALGYLGNTKVQPLSTQSP